MPQYLIVRGADLLILGAEWTGFESGGPSSGGPVLIAGSAAQIILTFPPQSLAEQALGPDVFARRAAMLGGPSRLAFSVAEGTQVTASAEGILAAVADITKTSLVSQGPDPDVFTTAIEMPWRLVISAIAKSNAAPVFCDHPAIPITVSGVTGVWQTGLRAGDGTAADPRLALLPLAYAPDDPRLDTSYFSNGMKQIVFSESWNRRIFPDMKRLQLGALGGSMAAKAIWPTFEWEHEHRSAATKGSEYWQRAFSIPWAIGPSSWNSRNGTFSRQRPPSYPIRFRTIRIFPIFRMTGIRSTCRLVRQCRRPPSPRSRD